MTDTGMPDENLDAPTLTRDELEAALDISKARLQRTEMLCEQYRLSAKARAEEVTRLLLRPTAATASDRELRKLREIANRRVVRIAIAVLTPIEKPYQTIKPRLRKLIHIGKNA